MEKFTLYDFLGLILPGFIFVYFCNVINKFYCLIPDFIVPADTETKIVIVLSLSLIFGSIIYALNFYLVSKIKWYSKWFGIYKPVSDIYESMNQLHGIMNETLNRQAKKWFGTSIFFAQEKFKTLTANEAQEARDFQNDFYNRMYYELEFDEKIENSRTYQSFYYFFRQLLSVGLILTFIFFALELITLIPDIQINRPDLSTQLQIVFYLLFMIWISMVMARWFRKRMVMKMYWSYFTYLNKSEKK